MLATFVDRALALLDRRFLVGYWMPAFLFGLLLFFTAGWSLPWLGLTAADYFALQGLRLSGITLGLLFLVTLLAYLLRAFTRPIIRTYEGYWPWWRLQAWGIRRRQAAWRRLRQQREASARQNDRRRYGHLQARLYRDFPSREDRILPTRLGNVLRAAEDYSTTRYGLDGVFWWPRLEPLLPESLLARLEATFMGLVALLNLATLSVLYALLLLFNLLLCWRGCVTMGRDFWWWSWPLVAVLALVVAYVIYRGAVAQARAYGDLIRVAYDEHRFRVLEALHIARPQTPAEEHALWRRLSRWLYQQDLGAARALSYAWPRHAEEEADPTT
ncbi:MAG: hypothetical protein Q9O62_11140 [Ardenticatenia bacterium]|nr:hypothetical protein [Ardenticatenia bacterium]